MEVPGSPRCLGCLEKSKTRANLSCELVQGVAVRTRATICSHARRRPGCPSILDTATAGIAEISLHFQSTILWTLFQAFRSSFPLTFSRTAVTTFCKSRTRFLRLVWRGLMPLHSSFISAAHVQQRQSVTLTVPPKPTARLCNRSANPASATPVAVEYG